MWTGFLRNGIARNGVGSPAIRPTFADVSLTNQAPQHVGTVVTVGRSMERLPAEEVTVTTFAIAGFRHAVLPAAGRVHSDGW